MSKPVILIVDDEKAYARVVKEALIPLGLDVLTVYDAMEAMFALQKGTPDLILLDVMMPEIDGLSLLRWLRDNSGDKRIPILIVSAKATPEDQEAARRAGADGFLAKPFTMQDLRELLSEFLPLPSSYDL